MLLSKILARQILVRTLPFFEQVIVRTNLEQILAMTSAC
jgi:hypothetical protein